MRENCHKCVHKVICDLWGKIEGVDAFNYCGNNGSECAHFAPDGWIPVTERLPKSEQAVLVSAVSKQYRYRHTLMAAHIGHHEVTTEDWREYEGDTEYDEENDCFWIPECWWESNAIEDNGNWIIDGDYDVTHWMPLPEPPKENNNA